MWARAVPYEEFGRLRREAPVAWSPDEGSGFWSVSRYADIVAASRDVAMFSSARGVSFEEPTGLGVVCPYPHLSGAWCHNPRTAGCARVAGGAAGSAEAQEGA